MNKIIALGLLLIPTLALAQQDVKYIIDNIVVAGIIRSLIALFFSLAVLYFIWGLVKFINKSGEDKEREGGRQMMIYGIIALAVMVSVWGLVTVVVNTFFPGGYSSLPQPKIPTFP